MTDSDPIYSAEASHIPLVVWKNAKHPEICKAFIEYLYDTDNYVEFIHSVPVGMLPSLKDIATNSDYLNNDTIKEYSDCVDVIQTAVDEGHAIGFEHGPSAQASYRPLRVLSRKCSKISSPTAPMWKRLPKLLRINSTTSLIR